MIGVISRSAICEAGPIFSRKRPGSPWIPIPISTSSSASSKLGEPLAGVMQGVSAIPIERPLALTRRPSSATSRQRAAVLGGGAADLLQDHGDPDAAASGRVQRVLHRDVVVGHDRLDLDAVGCRQVGGHVEVHHVAGVVLDDVQDAGAAVDSLRGGLHLVGGGGGEHLAGARRVEHAHADEPAVHRLVA